MNTFYPDTIPNVPVPGVSFAPGASLPASSASTFYPDTLQSYPTPVGIVAELGGALTTGSSVLGSMPIGTGKTRIDGRNNRVMITDSTNTPRGMIGNLTGSS